MFMCAHPVRDHMCRLPERELTVEFALCVPCATPHMFCNTCICADSWWSVGHSEQVRADLLRKAPVTCDCHRVMRITWCLNLNVTFGTHAPA